MACERGILGHETGNLHVDELGFFNEHQGGLRKLRGVQKPFRRRESKRLRLRVDVRDQRYDLGVPGPAALLRFWV